jgi:hypothetical protein
MVSRIRGEVDVRYARCVRELNRGSAEDVSSAVVVLVYHLQGIHHCSPLLSYSCEVMHTHALFCAGNAKFDSRIVGRRF